MRIPKCVKELPWPVPWEREGKQDFIVTFSWPVVDHERLLVATFNRNRKKAGKWVGYGADFRLICWKKQNRAAVLYKGDRCAKRHDLQKAMHSICPSPEYCYPEISQEDEIALAKWLRKRGTNNHLMPELAAWVKQAVAAEILAEKDARGELRDEDVDLCPDEMPDGLTEYIRREVLPTDNVLLYKKGNVRGTCFRCRQQVRARYERFKHCGITRCPNCGGVVTAYLETSDNLKVDYVNNIITIQKGTDGKTLFARQWHLCRDSSAQWETIEPFLKEVARYAIRDNRAAKWQKEAKSTWYYSTERYPLESWTRVESVWAVYDGTFFFYLPTNWREILEGTSLRYCDLGGYITETDRNRRDANPVRFLVDWARYPAVEKFWKAGYTGVVHEKMRGIFKDRQYTVRWNADSIQKAIRFPFRFLQTAEPDKWDLSRMKRLEDVWQMVQDGRIREGELPIMVDLPCSLECVQRAIGHASVRKIDAYIREQRKQEEARRDPQKRYYGELHAPHTWRDYLNDCVKLQMDLNDHSVLFPKDLDAAHQRTIAKAADDAMTAAEDAKAAASAAAAFAETAGTAAEAAETFAASAAENEQVTRNAWKSAQKAQQDAIESESAAFGHKTAAETAATNAAASATAAETAAGAAETAAVDAAKQVAQLGMSRNTVANALKGTAQGASITLDDVSPLEHTIPVRVQSKNLVDYSKITKYYDDVVTIDGNVITLAAGSNGWGLKLNGVAASLEVGKTYTFSFSSLTGIDTAATKQFGFSLVYKGSTSNTTFSGYYTGAEPYTLKITKEVSSVQFRTGWGEDIDEDIVITGIQIEEGSAATEYTPFVPATEVTLTAADPEGTQTATYTPAEDGSCEVASIAPAMVLTTDNENTVISCEYNRDINKAYDQLVQAILSLGGNI